MKHKGKKESEESVFGKFEMVAHLMDGYGIFKNRKINGRKKLKKSIDEKRIILWVDVGGKLWVVGGVLIFD